ncbi:MAG: type II toxin-antitoxin system RelE/ParE family toxin [Clostridiales bacterium]
MSKYKIIISDISRQMLENHICYLANISKAGALKLKEKFLIEIRSLEEFPERFPFFNGEFIPTNKYHKMVIEKRYLVLYQIKDLVIFVDYILDYREDYQWLIR